MAELTATIDMREKTGTGRIVEEAVPLILEGERFEFFMTNDYATISGKMKSLGYWRPTAFELKPNPSLDKRICNKMLELGATWSVTVTDEAGLVSYYDETAEAFFSLPLRGISSRMDGCTYPQSFVLAASDKGAELEALIRDGADINERIDGGMPLLTVAALKNACSSLRTLLKMGADVNAADEEGMTALMYAAVKHDARTMFFLIGKGADKDAKSAEGKDAGDYFGESDTRDIGELIADRAKAKAAPADTISARQAGNAADSGTAPAGSTAQPGAGTAGSQAGTGAVPEASPGAAPGGHKSFGETFDFYMKKYFERFPDKENPDIYKAAGLDKRRFSKILSSRNIADYRPRKETVTALALGLRLSLAESEDLLQSAGCILSPRDKADMKIQSFFAAGNYNIFDLNNSIYESTGRLFFKSMTAGEEG